MRIVITGCPTCFVSLLFWVALTSYGKEPSFREFRAPGPIDRVGLSPTSKLFAISLASTHDIVVMESSTGKIVRKLTHGGFSCEDLRFSDDDQVLFCQSGSGLFNGKKIFDVWSLKDGSQLLATKVIQQATAADLSPDGKTLLFGGIDLSGLKMCKLDRDFEKVTDVTVKLPSKTPIKLPRVAYIRYSSDGSRVLCVTVDPEPKDPDGEQRAYVLDSADFSIRSDFSASDRSGRRIVGVMANGDLLATENGDNAPVIDLTAEKTLFKLPEDNHRYQGLGLMSGGKRLVAVAAATLRVIDLDSRAVVTELKIPPKADWSYKGDFIVTTDGNRTLRLWHLADSSD